jgi:mono/diheme cytochrome c family protein
MPLPRKASARRWITRLLGGLAALCVAAAGYVYVMSAVRLNRTYSAHDVPLSMPSDSASLARGEHVARLSCYGCHRERLEGGVMFDEPGVARIVTPNVIQQIRNYTDAGLAGYLRYGVKRDGTSGVVMPPPGFYHMSDADLAAVIAYLRRQPLATTPPLPRTSIGPLGRLGVVIGQFRTAINDIDTTASRVGGDPAHRSTRKGEYLARMVCANCHGSRLDGNPATHAPALAQAVGYSLDQFTTLLREGKPNSDKTLTLMGEAARAELRHLTNDEIAAVFAYLRSLPTSSVARR